MKTRADAAPWTFNIEKVDPQTTTTRWIKMPVGPSPLKASYVANSDASDTSSVDSFRSDKYGFVPTESSTSNSSVATDSDSKNILDSDDDENSVSARS
ncbi:MAG: hypothetical protein ACXWIN_08075 [Burkholderiaceae bacterium]